MMMMKPFLSEYLLGGRKVIFSGFRSLCFFSFWEEGVATVFLSLYANEANETARFIYICIYICHWDGPLDQVYSIPKFNKKSHDSTFERAG